MSPPSVSPGDPQTLLRAGGAAVPEGAGRSVSRRSPVPLRPQLVLLLRGQASPPAPGNQSFTGSSIRFFSRLPQFCQTSESCRLSTCLASAPCDICLMCCRGRMGSETIPAYRLLGFEELRALSGISMTGGDSSVLQ